MTVNTCGQFKYDPLVLENMMLYYSADLEIWRIYGISQSKSSNFFNLMILTQSQERLTELVVASTNSVSLSWLWVNLMQHFFFWDRTHWTQGWPLFQTHYHSGTSIERVTAWILKALSVSTQTRMSYELLQHCER